MTDTAYPFHSSLLGALARNWWLILLRGIAAIAFGILTFVWPGVTLVTLVLCTALSRSSTACSHYGRVSRAARQRRAGG